MKRREFIQIASITSLSLLATGCKSFAGKSQHLLHVEHYVKADNTTVLKVAKQVFNDKNHVAIAYEKNAIGVVQKGTEYIASLLVCTHLGCGIEFNESTQLQNEIPGYICPCHGAKYNATGQRLSGPATKDLTTYPTSHDDHFIYIYISV